MGGLTDELDATLRFCTRDGGQERARIDAQGLSCRQFAADSYLGLVDRYDAFDGFRPASANALANAYVDLSNMFAASQYASGSSNGPEYTLVDSYVSTSVSQAPTANALRTAYSSLSNAFGAQVYLLSNSVRGMVYSAIAAFSFVPTNAAQVFSPMRALMVAPMSVIFRSSRPTVTL